MSIERTNKEWRLIHEFLRTKPDEGLGVLLREYIDESCHGGWDGFETRDMTGIRRMLTDLRIYGQNGGG